MFFKRKHLLFLKAPDNYFKHTALRRGQKMVFCSDGYSTTGADFKNANLTGQKMVFCSDGYSTKEVYH